MGKHITLLNSAHSALARQGFLRDFRDPTQACPAAHTANHEAEQCHANMITMGETTIKPLIRRKEKPAYSQNLRGNKDLLSKAFSRRLCHVFSTCCSLIAILSVPHFMHKEASSDSAGRQAAFCLLMPVGSPFLN